MVLLISYDLDHHARPQAYETLRGVLEGRALSFRRPLYSQWLVETNESPAVWARLLYRVIHRDDRLLISEMTADAEGWLPREHWRWLKQRVRVQIA
jgi:hypothetical protein